MKLHTLTPSVGAVKKGKRIARGQGSGKGGTSTRGHKGAKSRSGYSRKIGFEGGQMPLQRRVPKFGFKNPNRVEYKAVNLSILQGLADKGTSEITLAVLADNGVISKRDKVKILAKGELSAKVSVEAHAYSAASKAAIEKSEGEAKIIS